MKRRGYLNTKNIRSYQTNPMKRRPSSRPSRPTNAGPNRSRRLMQMSDTSDRPMDETMTKSRKRQQSVNSGNERNKRKERNSEIFRPFSQCMDNSERGSDPPIRSPSKSLLHPLSPLADSHLQSLSAIHLQSRPVIPLQSRPVIPLQSRPVLPLQSRPVIPLLSPSVLSLLRLPAIPLQNPSSIRPQSPLASHRRRINLKDKKKMLQIIDQKRK